MPAILVTATRTGAFVLAFHGLNRFPSAITSPTLRIPSQTIVPSHKRLRVDAWERVQRSQSKIPAIGLFEVLDDLTVRGRRASLELNLLIEALCCGSARQYLEQNSFVHDHFGRLREESFVKDKSISTVQPPNPETIGLYTFKVSGTKAKGTLEMLWAREVENGALTVTAIRITEGPYSHPLTSHGLKEVAPRYSGLPDGPLATLSAFARYR